MELRPAISFKRSRWELPIDVAEHRSIFKNNQSTHYNRFISTPKTGKDFLNQAFPFSCVPKNYVEIQLLKNF